MREYSAIGSLDWGFNAPGCFLLWMILPDGHYHIWREIKFQYKTVFEVSGIIKTQMAALGVKLDYLVADPACWQHTGAGRGEAIAETMTRLKLPMRKGDNDRKSGWQRVHELLRLAPDGRPWLTIDPSCKYLARTLAGAMCDKNDADDVNTQSDDHALDSLRYGAMSRMSPYRVMKPKRTPPAGSPAAIMAKLREKVGKRRWGKAA